MSRAQAESWVKNLTGDIVRECAVRGHAVSDRLAAFMVKAMVLDPKNGFNVDWALTKQDVQKLKKLCLDKLLEKCSPSLDTIKMQLYFDMNYTSRSEFLKDIHRAVESRLISARRDITDSRAKSREELDALYHKIISYILLHSAMGSSTDSSTVQETAAALQSVFPPTELGPFMVLLKREKEQHLSEISMITTGIRLFNKTTKTGDEEVERLPASLKEVFPVTSKNIEKELQVTQTLAWKYTAVLEKLMDPSIPPRQSDVPIVLLKDVLYNVRQHEAFLKILLADTSLCVKNIEVLQSELLSQIKRLKETVQSKAAVATATVFPLFTVLSKLWSGLQDETELLNIFNNIRLNLQSFLTSQAMAFSEDYLDSLLQGSEVKTDHQRIAESSGKRIDPAQMKTQEWLLPETTTNFNELPVQYDGLCGYTLVNRDGLLLPGNPNIGVLKHNEKVYVFSSKEVALKFASTPDYFVAEVEKKAKSSPELIQLLKLHQQFSCISPYSEIQPAESSHVKPISKCESGTQTDIHPVETNIVKLYEWNEWELRRKALKLADLRTKVTHSTQTDQSHMRRENVTQTWPPKDAACQSKRDGQSNVPKPQTYLAGLRGQRDTHVVKTNLTRSVDE
ncbi:cilia- and flagella-associated protein 206 [Pholidichthys leucotaenia]